MQATANQVRWIPIEEIVEEGQADDGGSDVLVARQADGRYALLAGRDRLHRMREAGRACVDAVLSPTERLEERFDRLLDGAARGELHYLDEAQEYSLLMSFGVSVAQIAQRIGRTPATVRRKLRLLELDAACAQLLRAHDLCEGYAREALRIPGAQGRVRMLRHVVQQSLSLKETQKLVDELLARMPVPVTGGRRMRPVIRDYRLYVNAIRGVVEQMCDAGLDAAITVQTGKNVAEVRITVPTFGAAAR